MPAAGLRRWCGFYSSGIVLSSHSNYGETTESTAHTGPHGIGQKSSDLSAIPLCARHHRTGDDWYHKLGPRKFAEVHRLNVRAVVTRLSAKPIIRIESGGFVGRLGDHEYELGSTSAGLARAIRRMSEVRREVETEVA